MADRQVDGQSRVQRTPNAQDGASMPACQNASMCQSLASERPAGISEAF